MNKNIRGQTYLPEDRNPFLVLLIKRMLKSETLNIYDRLTGNIEEYLAIPRTGEFMTVKELKKASANSTDDSLKRGRGTNEKIIGHNIFNISDLHLHRILSSINFFGSFDDWQSFNEKFLSMASFYEAYRGIKFDDFPNHIKSKLENDVYDVWRAEDIFIQQALRLSETPRTYTYKLPDNYALGVADYDERMAIAMLRNEEVYGFSSIAMDYRILEVLISYNSDIVLVLLDPWCKICGSVIVIPLEADPFGDFKSFFTLQVLAAGLAREKEEVRSIFIQELMCVHRDNFILLLQNIEKAFQHFIRDTEHNPFIITDSVTPDLIVKYFALEQCVVEDSGRKRNLYFTNYRKLVKDISLYSIQVMKLIKS